MSLLKQTFRLWWQKPRAYDDQEEERSVTFLELFYDLVYVVVIAELAHGLAAHVSLGGLAEFAFLFTLVWWAWLNGSVYHDLHGNNDIRTRIFTFVQMFCIAAMAVFAHNAMGTGSTGFAISYAGFLLVLTYLWWRSGVHDKSHQPLSRPYSATFLLSTLLFAISPFVPEPWRYVLWGIAMLPALSIMFVFIRLGKTREKYRDFVDNARGTSPSLIERFGLFTIIVLGEVVVGVVQGVAAQHHFTWRIGLTAGLGMLVAIGFWWLYFDFISTRSPKRGMLKQVTWMYTHLPATIGIAATGAAVLNVVGHTGTDLDHQVRWLLVGSIAITLLSYVMLMSIVVVPEGSKPLLRIGRAVTLAAAGIAVVLGLSGLETIPLLIALVLLLLAPVFYAFRFWIRRAVAQGL